MQSNNTPVTKAPKTQKLVAPVVDQAPSAEAEEAKNQLLQKITAEIRQRDHQILSLKRQVAMLLTERASNKKQIAAMYARIIETSEEALKLANEVATEAQVNATEYNRQLQNELAATQNGGNK